MEEEEGIGVVTGVAFEAAVMRTRIALRTNGFGIISEMPAPIEIGEEAGRRHLFMSVWDALVAASNLGGPGLDVGDHMHCHVVVFEEGDETVVAALDPTEGMEGVESSVAVAMREALEKVFAQVVSED